MSDTSLTLEYPFDHKGEHYSELSFRRVKMRDLKKWDGIKGDMARSIMMIADLAEIDPKAVEELDPMDFDAASKVIADFMPAPSEDGKES